MTSTWLNPALKAPKPLSRRREAERGLLPLNPNAQPAVNVADAWETRLALFHTAGKITDCDVALLRGIVRGLSNKELAAERSVALNTVKNELYALFGKLGATSRTHAVCIVLGVAEPRF